jgi:glycosyltransferase involved in cell wall biosynthesis
MIQNRRWEVKSCIDRVLPYVDKIILVDGGSVDDSIVYFRNLEKEEPKLEFYLCPWRDNFPMQRNKYLQHVPEGNWVIVSDPDELFLEDTCKEWRRLADEAEAEKLEWNGYSFRANDITLSGEKVVCSSKPENSRKPLMFWKYSSTKYLEERNPHEQLVCAEGYRYKSTDLFYQHLKQDRVTWVRGCRNFFIGGGGPNLGASNPIWMPFRELVVRKTRITKWDEFNNYLIRGSIDKDIKQKFIEFRLITGFDGSSELRECYKYYFRILHPEEEPEELRGERIQ